MAKEKQKETVTDKGKKQLTTAEKGKKNSCPMVQVLQERNTGVVIRDEQDIMRLHEDKRKAEAMAMEKQKETVVDKGKKKITTAGNGKENLCPTDDACANDDVEGVPPRVTQPFICPTSVPSTSYAPQRSSKKNPLFGTCCLQGKVRLPLLITPPPPLQALYDGNDDQSKSFRTHTRECNAANAFTSLGATLDTRVLSGRGPTSFTIHGELRHRTGSLLPVPGEQASYAQLYIYDPNSAVEVRTHRNPQLRRDVLQTIQDSLLQVNSFVGKFRHAYAVLNQLASTGQSLPAHLHYSSSKDRRRYNLPTSDEIAVVIPGDGTEVSGMRDIILHLRGDNGLMRINECHPAYLPLHYVLLFPRGELGWEPELKQWDVQNRQPSNNRLTQMQFYSYRSFECSTEYSTILRAGKLFQEFLVDAWAATEQNRLAFHKLNQEKLRTGLYQDLTDVGIDDVGPDQIGQRVVLPSSFIGSPRHMFEIFQDSMAITRYNHHPDIFLTITANPKWPKITASLLPHQKAIDRPDLVARVFELKRNALMKEIEHNNVFEAAWRIFGHHLHEEVPAVVRLALHLPGMHQCAFNPKDTLEQIRARASLQKSTLTSFFEWYTTNPNAEKYTYQEFPQFFVWDKSNKRWTPRISGFAIGRMYFASPNCGERFYMRLLLTVVKGPKSFEDLRTFNDVLHDTFKSACVARGLLEDDEEWVQCLQEAAIIKTGNQLRRLFSIILTQCSPIQPYELWKQFAVHICDDIAHKIRTCFPIPSPSDAQIEDYGLYLLDQMLQESSKTLSDFPPMPQPTGNWSAVVGNRLVLEHQHLQIEAQQVDVQVDINRLNSAQRKAYDAITSSVLQNGGRIFFVSGGAGTGKTFLYNTIALKCRSLGHIVVTVASSGIASLLLVGGRTAHSTFCIPLDVMENSICVFSKQSIQAELFRQTTLIIWDEVPMQHKYCVEAVDRTLRDICNCEKPFGGITVVLGGDFRQILPVITKGVREQIVNASLRHSVLWKEINVLTLDVNMRLDQADQGNANFAKFLLEIGTNPQDPIKLPPTIQKCQDLNELLSIVYPQLHVAGTSTPKFLTERTILSARNEDVSSINIAALNIFPGEAFTYLAADRICEEDEIDRTITNHYPNEFLNSLDPPGLPPFKVELKVGCPIMLLRNIAPKAGLCNGTRLMVVRCASRIIEALILSGEKFGNLAFIPRITLTPSSSEFPFRMTRRQFPIRLAYALTINKSQGQSVKFVGVDLRTPVFSHGQLYVALSRCTSFDRVSVLLPKDELDSTANIVYPEVLL
ncbi:hypothetical protein RHSIM_Rhsim07G0256200 [Rhododendron simsii]|uniref:ATP-dependent DNA helicase n=1 Tax=Rhododendron simsii TaxID=118357 RepID=A0A834LFV7_RHOSS|nr:hypothetical protein RHSIM_Rhsim07G0256200 [Rhododendron simsii]